MCMFLLNMFVTRTAVHSVQLCYPKCLVMSPLYIFFVLLLFSLYAQTDPQSVSAVILFTVPL